MKIITAVVLAVMMVFSLAACAGAEEKTEARLRMLGVTDFNDLKP